MSRFWKSCFCQSCRRASGAPSVAWFTVSVGDYRLLSGTPQAHRSSPLVTRTFCPTCGTTLTYQHDESAAEIDLTTATLDEPDAAAPLAEIWLAHKLGWAASDDGLPRFAQERPAGA